VTTVKDVWKRNRKRLMKLARFDVKLALSEAVEVGFREGLEEGGERLKHNQRWEWSYPAEYRPENTPPWDPEEGTGGVPT